ncbi:MAG: potassium transporter [Methanomassiliicoccales archaeon PtaU1.Bin124]|nr:MAG: potassium transporter [Methanomassiliicoccales archaeon PtaU1.Bin124]
MIDRWTKFRRGVRSYLKLRGIDRYLILERVSRKENSIAHLMGLLTFYLSLSMLLPLFVAIWYQEDVRPWIFPILLTLIIGTCLLIRYRPHERIRPTEAMFVIGCGWLYVMAIGAIPYLGYGMGMIDALFESMSGFTTTGSSIIIDLNAWPLSLLFWRSFTQWLGGAGIILIFVSIFPMLGVGGRNLARGELSGGFEVHNFTLRIKDEIKKFHVIFMALSAILVLLLLLTGIGLYDSLVVMFSTISTGGFSPHPESIAHYNNAILEWIVIIFMILGSTSFYLHYQVVKKRQIRQYLANSEFVYYLAIILAASTIVLLSVFNTDLSNLESNIRTSMFQVVSLMSSTGFASVDFSLWNDAMAFLLLALIIVGGCSGSTAGGLKIGRFKITLGFIHSCLYKAVHPRAIFMIKLDGRPLKEDTVTSMVAVLICYVATALIGAAFLILLGIEPDVSLSAVITTLSNCGPALGALGPMGTFGGLPDAAKIILTLTMWIGRLEFISVLVILTPVFWKDLFRYQEKN